MKFKSKTELRIKVMDNMKVYREFQSIYGYSLPDEYKIKYRALSSIDSEIPFVETINDILTNIIKRDLFEDWEDNKVYYLMIRFLENTCEVDDNLVRKALQTVKK